MALRTPPCFSEPDSWLRYQNHTLGASKYKVFLRFYKVLGELMVSKHLHFVKNAKFPKAYKVSPLMMKSWFPGNVEFTKVCKSILRFCVDISSPF